MNPFPFPFLFLQIINLFYLGLLIDPFRNNFGNTKNDRNLAFITKISKNNFTKLKCQITLK